MYVALIGNLSEGFKVVGPFTDFDAAAEHCDGMDSWIVQLHLPEGGAQIDLRTVRGEWGCVSCGRTEMISYTDMAHNGHPACVGCGEVMGFIRGADGRAIGRCCEAHEADDCEEETGKLDPDRVVAEWRCPDCGRVAAVLWQVVR